MRVLGGAKSTPPMFPKSCRISGFMTLLFLSLDKNDSVELSSVCSSKFISRVYSIIIITQSEFTGKYLYLSVSILTGLVKMVCYCLHAHV